MIRAVYSVAVDHARAPRIAKPVNLHLPPWNARDPWLLIGAP